MVKPRITWIVPVNILSGTDGSAIETCTTVDTCGAYVGRFLPTPFEYAPVADITFKIDRRKKS